MSRIKFADLCSGIGGFRLGLEAIGWECVFSSDIDQQCESTYEANFGSGFDAYDIADIVPGDMPAFDVLCAGFPCQPFSVAGKQKGFDDPRGRVFDELMKLTEAGRPRVVFLENVANLLRHDKGKTFDFMTSKLRTLGYNVSHTILDSAFFGVPQSRPRLFIVAIRESEVRREFSFPSEQTAPVPFRPYLDHGNYSIPISDRWQEYIDLYTGKKSLSQMSFPVPKTRRALERIAPNTDLEDCVLQIRSSGIRALSLDAPLPTLAVSHSGGGAMIPVYTGERRHLNLIEMKRLMGFPDDFEFPVARTHAIKQLANAVCPPVIRAIGERIEMSLTSRGILLTAL